MYHPYHSLRNTSQDHGSYKSNYTCTLWALLAAIAAIAIVHAAPWDVSGSTGDLVSRAPISCFNDNSVRIPCDDIDNYINQCGVICPNGTRVIGSAGCTNLAYSPLTPSFGK